MKILSADEVELIFNNLNDLLENNSNNQNKLFVQLFSLIKTIYKKIASSEKQLFLSFSNYFYFVNSKYEIPDSIIEKINTLKKIEYRLRKDKSTNINSNQLSYLLHTIFDLLEFFSEIKYPFTIPEIYSEKVEIIDFNSKSIKYQISEVEILRVAILEKGSRVLANGVITQSELLAYNDEIGEVRLIFYGLFAEIHKMVWKGAILNLLNIKHKKENIFVISGESIVVLEPDDLLDITEIAECFSDNSSNYKIFFLKKFSDKKTTLPLVIGNLVNYLFDELVLDNEVDFDIALKNAFEQKPLQLFALKKQDEHISKTVKSILENQFYVLKNVVKDLKADYYSIESSYISPLYGLQGRLDLLLEYKNDAFLKDVVELKSGNAPNINYGIKSENGTFIPTGVWYNHLMQTTGYNLLLDSAYFNRRGSSMILYSKAEFMQLRNTPNIDSNKKLFINLRNKIIAEEKKLESGIFSIFKQFDSDNFGIASNFIQRDLAIFFNKYSKFNSLENAYFEAFYKFIIRELLAEKFDSNDEISSRGNSTSYWSMTIDEKENSLTIIKNLKILIDETDFYNLHLKFKWLNEGIDISSLRKGDNVVLYPDSPDFHPTKSPLIKCVIRQFDGDLIVLSIRNKLLNTELFFNYDSWIIEVDQMDTNVKRLFNSLFEFLVSDEEKKKIIFGLTKPDFSDKHKVDYSELDEYRNNIIKQAVNANSYYLVQGPPGTGKTSFLLKYIVKYLFENTETDILILAYTNRAVDEICNSISKIADNFFLRIGTKEATDDKNTLIAHLANTLPLKQLGTKINQTRIFVSTVFSALSNTEIFEIKKFDYAIIDEASQILEPQIIGILSKVEKFIMIGDEKQLPAVVTQKSSLLNIDNNDLNSINLKYLGVSLFERLVETCNKNEWYDAIGLLKKQGRMHKEIQNLANYLFYNDNLESFDDNEEKFSLEELKEDSKLAKLLNKSRVIFINTPTEKRSKVNMKEAELISLIINKLTELLDNNLKPNSIGVVSPFKAQCSEITKRISNELSKYITIDTVERFQGSERDFMIYSICANNKYMLNNISSISNIHNQIVDRKLNVAITRARKHLIILGNEQIINNSVIYANLLRYIKKNSIYLDAIEFFDFVR